MDIKPVVIRPPRGGTRTLLGGALAGLVLGGGGTWTAITNPLLSSSKTMYLYHLPGVARVIMGIISVPLLLFGLIGLLVAAVSKKSTLILSVSGISASASSFRDTRISWHEIGSLLLVAQPGEKLVFRPQFMLVDSQQDLSFLPHRDGEGESWYEIPLGFNLEKAMKFQAAVGRFRPRLVEKDIRTSRSRLKEPFHPS
jgi:hypothetical protein